LIEEDFRPSIVISSYNQKEFLIEAVESVLSQTLCPYEILIPDDGSTDGSQTLIRSYEQKYPNLIKGVLQKQNIGIPRNRNEALKIVKGNYVGILDGDDLFEPNKLEKQFEKLKENPDANAVYGNFLIFNEQSNSSKLKWKQRRAEGDVLSTVAKIQTGILRTLIVKYDLVRTAGFMDCRLPIYDGLWLIIQLAAMCQFTYIDEVLVRKRDHEASVSKGIDKSGQYSDLALIYKMLMPLLINKIDIEIIEDIDVIWKKRLRNLRGVDLLGSIKSIS